MLLGNKMFPFIHFSLITKSKWHQMENFPLYVTEPPHTTSKDPQCVHKLLSFSAEQNI